MKKIILLFVLFCISTLSAQKFSVKEIQASEELHGDLYSTGSKTVVVLVPGSGPTDRNGNSLGMATNNSLKMLATELAQNQIDVFTYDKRVVYLLKNRKEIPSLNFSHGIEDVKTIIEYLRNEFQYENIVIAGHSEGSLVGMMASLNHVNAYISLAGSGKPIDEILIEQIDKNAPALSDDNRKIIIQLKEGKKVTEVHPLLLSLYAEANQDFLMEWMNIHPMVEISKLNIPILIIQGTEDLQVGIENAEMLKSANKNAELVFIKQMNHIFKFVNDEKQNMISYNNPDMPLHKDLTPAIVNFIKNNLK